MMTILRAILYRLPEGLTDEKILAIWKNIANGVGDHGDFLKCFGQAVARADAENFILLRPAAIGLIRKYHLDTEALSEV